MKKNTERETAASILIAARSMLRSGGSLKVERSDSSGDFLIFSDSSDIKTTKFKEHRYDWICDLITTIMFNFEIKNLPTGYMMVNDPLTLIDSIHHVEIYEKNKVLIFIDVESVHYSIKGAVTSEILCRDDDGDFLFSEYRTRNEENTRCAGYKLIKW